MAEVPEQRTPKYKSAAHHEIDTDPLTPEQVAEKIIQICGKKAVESVKLKNIHTEPPTSNSPQASKHLSASGESNGE